MPWLRMFYRALFYPMPQPGDTYRFDVSFVRDPYERDLLFIAVTDTREKYIQYRYMMSDGTVFGRPQSISRGRFHADFVKAALPAKRDV